MSPSEHERVCDPAGPVIEQAEPLWDAMVHVIPVREGSGSLTVTAVAVPGPPLPTVTVKPTLVPAVTGVSSAVLVMARLGAGGGGTQFSVQGGVVTSMVAKACTNPPLVDDAVAVLGSDPEVAPVVGLVMWTV